MAFSDEVKKSTNRIYADVYLKRRYPDGSFDTDWIDITRWVRTDSIGSMKFSLDSGDYDVGIFVVSSMSILFDNSTGKFNDNTDSRSLWAAFESRNLSKVKIEAGYINDDDTLSAATPFTGILDERSMRTSDNDTVAATLSSLDSVLTNNYVVPGTLSSATLASDAIFTLCNRSEVTDYVTVTGANINPGLDVTIDTTSDFDGRKLNLVIN